LTLSFRVVKLIKKNIYLLSKPCQNYENCVFFLVVAVFGVVAAYLASAGKQQFAVVNGCPETGEHYF
jgi:hypothetical protein